MANNTTGRTTKPKQATKGTKAKTNTTKTSKAPVKDKAAKPEAVEPIEDKDTGIVKSPGKGNKKAYLNSPFVGGNAIKASDNDMEGYWNNALTVYQWPKIDLDNDSEVEERCALYFEHCRQTLERPTIEGLSVAIGISPRTLYDWEQGVTRGNVGSTRPQIIKKSKALIQYMLAQMAVGNKIYPNVWIFYGKNWFGMSDTQNIVITTNNALQPTMSMEEIADKVAKDVVIDTDYSE